MKIKFIAMALSCLVVFRIPLAAQHSESQFEPFICNFEETGNVQIRGVFPAAVDWAKVKIENVLKPVKPRDYRLKKGRFSPSSEGFWLKRSIWVCGGLNSEVSEGQGNLSSHPVFSDPVEERRPTDMPCFC